MKFGIRLRTLRKDKGMSQQTLADKVGMTREYVARLEGGLHDPPLSTVVKLAKALQVTLPEFLKSKSSKGG